ncbi:hypothetical protein QBC38DRAFT_226349 [Podospora fimiseda]|uniref:DUF6594 domain-containing protein n=1 Tax=Podospora fimiseda TaxID=252190 RepID=A0AAN7H1R2_9PEZI|nr:hypothetical protein QBC38DRAFT_226349 [Podospora fimiseda]
MAFQRRTRQPQPSAAEQANLFQNRPPTMESYREGYPRLAAFLNSEKEFTAFRHFGQVHVRLLLEKQDEIAQLEERLDQLDKNETNDFALRTRREHPRSDERRALFAELEAKVVSYDTLLDLYLRQTQWPRVKDGNAESIANWMRANKPIVARESTFLNNWDDLVAPIITTTNTQTVFDGWIAACAVLLHKLGLVKVFATSTDLLKSSNPHVVRVTKDRISIGTRLLTSILAILALTMPVVLLYSIRSIAARIKVVAVCSSGFAMFISFISQGRPIEVFSTTATYCAVLVVFLTYLPEELG